MSCALSLFACLYFSLKLADHDDHVLEGIGWNCIFLSKKRRFVFFRSYKFLINKAFLDKGNRGWSETLLRFFRMVIFLSSTLGWDSANSKRLFCPLQSTTGASTILGEEIGDKFALIDTSTCEVFGDEIGTEVDGLCCREVRFFEDFFLRRFFL